MASLTLAKSGEDVAKWQYDPDADIVRYPWYPLPAKDKHMMRQMRKDKHMMRQMLDFWTMDSVLDADFGTLHQLKTTKCCARQ
jgi:hypothetical protein